MNQYSVFTQNALLPNGWQKNVLLRWNQEGVLTAVTSDAICPQDTPTSSGPLIPGMPNLHSHAFQRAFSGLTEYRSTSQDSFWSWRDLMYRFANAISPEQLESIALALYIEMLEAGYTSVCEFHYIHHATDGQAYADDTSLCNSLIRAANAAGIALTLLPVLYQTGGFANQAPSKDQRRFIRSTDNMLRLLQRLKPVCDAKQVRLGLAPHSLRAVPPDSLANALAGLRAIDPSAPIHIHIAEQTAEVEACLAWSGQRPVEWLLNHAAVDRHWCLVHATHMTAVEAQRAAATGAVAGICPTTEANLGDGIFDAATWNAANGHWGIGSDSHSSVNAAEELMMLEYSQRLARQQRNVYANAEHPHVATAMTLAAVAGGLQASGHVTGVATSSSTETSYGISSGNKANFFSLNPNDALLRELPSAQAMLDTHVFASHRRSAIDQVWIAGAVKITAGIHPLRESANVNFANARRQLLEQK